MIKCLECGKDISSNAKRCVHCGENLTKKPVEKEKYICKECGNEIESPKKRSSTKIVFMQWQKNFMKRENYLKQQKNLKLLEGFAIQMIFLKDIYYTQAHEYYDSEAYEVAISLFQKAQATKMLMNYWQMPNIRYLYMKRKNLMMKE